MRGGATRLAVAAAAEAEELRLHFPDVRLLVMGALTEDELRTALTSRADVAIWRDGFRKLCSGIARELPEPARVHVKLDSGMGRLGERDATRLIELLGV
jgi:alanine racemase